MSSANGDKEEVVFTDNFYRQAADWCNPDLQVDFDGVIENTLPSIFPTNYNLVRE